MSSGLDVAGIYTALSGLPGRTPEQRALDEQSAAAIRAAEALDEDDEDERATEWAVERLRGVRLSKVARTAVAEALDVDPDHLVA